jgi:hypothetical protein
MIGGSAVRAAVALGIHMRNDSTRTPDTSKEIRYRVWWCLYALEHQLSMLTGRPSSITDGSCTTPLPIPIEEEVFQSQHGSSLLSSEMQKYARHPGLLKRSPRNQSAATSSSDRSRAGSKAQSASRSPAAQTVDFEWSKNVPPSPSLYFLHHIQLSKIEQSILDRLYTPESMQHTWSAIQSVISELDQSVHTWQRHLPSVFDFKRKQDDQTFVRYRMYLGFAYYSTRIIINRPCLCRLDRKIPHQSAKSRNFNQAAAATCVDSAREMLHMLPDEPNAVGLNRIGPWWDILRYLMQATVVLMLELSFRADHMPEEAESLFEGAKKAVRWLHKLGEENYSARRAWAISNQSLRDTAPKIGRVVEHLPENPPGPLSPPSYPAPAASFPNYSLPPIEANLMPTDLQSGANFTVQQQDLTDIGAFAAYDESASHSGSDPPFFFATAAEMAFMSDTFHNLPQGGDPAEQSYGGSGSGEGARGSTL